MSGVEQRLAEIEERANAAAPAPWTRMLVGVDELGIRADYRPTPFPTWIPVATVRMDDQDDPAAMGNAEFIAHAREDVPWLIEQLRNALRDAEQWKVTAKAQRTAWLEDGDLS